MDPNVIDPVLLTLHRQPGPAPWPVPHIVPSIAENINRLRRLPGQIGGVTIASLHSPSDAHDHHSFTSFPPNEGYYQNGYLQPPSAGPSHVSNAVTTSYLQVESFPQIPSAYHRQFPHIESQEKASYQFTQTRQNQSSYRLQAEDIPEPATRVYQQTTPEFPKFHCGEPGCRIFRTDGNNLTGRYAMSAHYKKRHPELNFDVTKLISSTTGEKSRPMLPKAGDDRAKREKKDSSSVTHQSNGEFQDNAVHLATRSMPAQPESTSTQTQRGRPFLKSDSAALHTPPQPLQDRAPPQYQHSTVHINNPQLPPRPTMPKLPRIRLRSFTDVYDLHETPNFFKVHIRGLRADCDTEFFTIRQLLLAYVLATNQPATAFPHLRKSETTRTLQSLHNFITRTIGPSDLDARAVGLGLQGDTVAECALIVTLGLQRVHLPDDGVWPDGTMLGRDENQRRYWCCELQAMKLCLFTFRRLVQTWSGRLESVTASRHATILPEHAETGDDGDCQMVDA